MNMHSKSKIKAFTLLEMIVVLTLVGFVTSISFPRLSKMYERVKIATQKDDLANQIKLLGFKAYQRGRAFTLLDATQNDQLLEMPINWYLVSGEEIHYSEIGVCSGGNVTFQFNTERITFQLMAPLCNPMEI